MTPNLLMTLDIEPHTLMWNGQAISLPGTYELVPDSEVRHLHKRVMAIALHERKRIPFCGRLVGKARHGNGKGSVWLINEKQAIPRRYDNENRRTKRTQSRAGVSG